MRVLTLPDLGEGLYEAEIAAWHVAVGDDVAVDDPLVSVETDKALTEIPSPRSGRIARLGGAVGERVRVGAALVEFADGDEPVASAPRALPAVRMLANELGLDLAAIAPTGADGTVTVADVARAIRGGGGAVEEPWQPLTGLRRSMAEAMARSHAEVVPATVHDDARIGGGPVTVRLVRALVAAAAAEPALNAWFDLARGRLLHDRVHVGVAVDTAEGLIVPVLRDARAEPDVAAAVERLAARARSRALGPDELRGATITLSNFGAIGGRYATPVVTPPQVAIVGAGRLRDALLPLSLTYDHRAATGGEAARFLAALIADLERKD